MMASRVAAKGASAIYLATDPDREGEAISWHVLEVLKQKRVLKDKTIKRVVFNSITKPAVLEAMANPREIDPPLVEIARQEGLPVRLVYHPEGAEEREQSRHHQNRLFPHTHSLRQVTSVINGCPRPAGPAPRRPDASPGRR